MLFRSREQGGHSIAVYRPNTSSKKAQKLITDRRADFISPADYSDGKSLDLIMKTIIEKIAASDAVRQMKRNS